MNARRTILSLSAATAFLSGAAMSAGAADLGAYARHHHHLRVYREYVGCYRPDATDVAVNAVAENGILNGAIGALLGAGARPKFNNDDTGFTYDNGYRAYMACHGLYRRRGISARY